MISRCLLTWAILVLTPCGMGRIAVAQQDEPVRDQSQQDKSASNARAAEESSSKDTRVDLDPPRDDQKNHPASGAAEADGEDAASDVQVIRTKDPPTASKYNKVGDFKPNRKNYNPPLALSYQKTVR